MTPTRIALHLLAGLLVAAPLAAQAEDASVRRRLEDRGVKFDIDKDGDFRIVYNYAQEKRSQLVYVSGDTQSHSGVLIRKVFSPAAMLSQNPIDGVRALELLRDADTNKMGAWEISGGVLFLSIKLPDSASATELKAAMDIAAELADNMEIKISGKKDAL
jgi:hypothetical protein